MKTTLFTLVIFLFYTNSFAQMDGGIIFTKTKFDSVGFKRGLQRFNLGVEIQLNKKTDTFSFKTDSKKNASIIMSMIFIHSTPVDELRFKIEINGTSYWVEEENIETWIKKFII